MSIADQTLPRPPRLLQDGTGYDWKELDRFLQRLYLLLGNPSDLSKSLNLIQSISNGEIDAGTNFALDHQHEIKMLEHRLESLIVEIDMISNCKQQIANILQMLQNIQVAQDMGA